MAPELGTTAGGLAVLAAALGYGLGRWAGVALVAAVVVVLAAIIGF